jgi:hypothetical protein
MDLETIAKIWELDKIQPLPHNNRV